MTDYAAGYAESNPLRLNGLNYLNGWNVLNAKNLRFLCRSLRSTGSYDFNVLLKWSMVRCQASFAASAS